MSGMKISKEEDERMTESRRLILDAMKIAFGSYVEQEAKKADVWRDQTYGQIYGHLKHEIKEIGRSKARTIQLHNAMDACSLSAILIAKLLEDALKEEEKWGIKR